MSSDVVATSQKPIVEVSPAGPGPKATMAATPPKHPFYPGDMICYDARKPYEWTPWYGNVLPPKLARLEGKDKDGNWPGEEVEEGWNFDEGINGTMEVQWAHSNRECTVQENEIGLVDRFMAVGQRVKQDNGTRGTVNKVTKKVAVQVLNTNHVIDNIPITDLFPVSPFVRGLEIYYHGWLGVITCVKRNIQCKLDSGPLFCIKSAETDGFMRGDPFWGRGTPCPSVRTRFASNTLKQARFNAGIMRFLYKWVPAVSYFHSSFATTLGVQAFELEVKWLQKCPTAKFVSDKPPSTTITSKNFKDVKPLGLPSYETIGLNSVRMYSVKPEDTVMSYTSWFTTFHNKMFDNKISGNYYAAPNNAMSHWAANKAFEVPVKLICRQTQVEVEWDDGVHQRLPSTKVPFVVRAKHTILPIGLVVEPVIPAQGPKKYGIIQQSDDCDTVVTKVVNVKWIMPGTEMASGETYDIGSQRESIYDLKAHSTYSMFRKGTIVFIKNHEKNYVIGTVLEMDIREGQLILAVPESKQPVQAWPHQVTPIRQRCYWNFFSRSWIVDEILLPSYQLSYDSTNGLPSENVSAVSLNANNNNSSARLQGTLWDERVYELLPEAPKTHRYYDFPLTSIRPELTRILQAEAINLKDNVPEGCWVRAYEDRLDLISALILGPEKTPYEDGLFFFDIQIPADFPRTPPKIHFVPYTQSMNPYISDEGDVCVSKLSWPSSYATAPPVSYVGAALFKLQELLFQAEPYFCMFRREHEIETPKGITNSRAYNEQVFLAVLTSLYKMALKPYDPWRQQISKHLSVLLPERIHTIYDWIEMDMEHPMSPLPTYNLFPVSKGFKMAVAARLEKLEQILPSARAGATEEESSRPGSASQKESASSVDIPADEPITNTEAVAITSVD